MEALRLTPPRRDRVARRAPGALGPRVGPRRLRAKGRARPSPFRGGFAGPDVAARPPPARRATSSRAPPSGRSASGRRSSGGGVSGLSAAWRLARAGDADFRVFELENARRAARRVSGANDVSRVPLGRPLRPRARVPEPRARGRPRGGRRARRPRRRTERPSGPRRCSAASPRSASTTATAGTRASTRTRARRASDVEQLNRFRVDDGRARGPQGRAGTPRVRDPDAPLVGRRRPRSPSTASTMAEWLDAQRLHVEAPALARRVRLPRRLRHQPRPDLRVGRHPLQRGAPARRGRGRGPVGLPHVARGERPPRRAPREVRRGTDRRARPRLRRRSRPPGRGARAPALPGREGAGGRRRRGAGTRSSRSRSTRRAHVFAPWRAAPPAWLDALSYAPWLVANVTLSGAAEGDGASRSRGTTSSTTRARSATSSRRTRPGRTTARRSSRTTSPSRTRSPRRRARTPPRGGVEGPRAAPFSRTSRAPTRTCPASSRAWTSRAGATRWLRPTPGFLSSPVRRLAPEGGVHFAHADSAGLPLFEEAQDAGVRAAEAILASRGVKSAPLSATCWPAG